MALAMENRRLARGASWRLPLVWVTALIAWGVVAAAAGAEDKLPEVGGSSLTLQNEFIRIVQNGGPKEAGRFSVSTTGGDPQRADDNQRPLIYGMDRPWTSYTTVRIDNESYLFGGPTDRRAGAKVPTGQVITAPRRDGNSLVTVCQIGPIRVEQRLSIVQSLDTGVEDSARVEYALTNTDTQPHQVGLRIMVDTMLGDNDGAPFRVGETAYESDASLSGSAVPDFWQAFDSLNSPHVTSQGTLRGPQLTAPDQLVFTNWGNLADHPWDVPLTPGRDFTRSGEYELDSATALFWNPVTVAPGQTRFIATQYGLAGISIARGDLAVGLSSPAQVVQGSVFHVIAYVENNVGEARDVQVTLDLPAGWRLVSGTAQRQLGILKRGASAQVAWAIQAQEEGTRPVTVRVTSSNSQPSQLTRQVQVVPGVQLQLEVNLPSSLQVQGERRVPNPVPLAVTVTNIGSQTADNVTLRLERTGAALPLASADSPWRRWGPLEPGQAAAATVTWWLTPQASGPAEDVVVGVSVASDNGPSVAATRVVQLPAVSPRVFLASPRSVQQPGGPTLVEVDVMATNIPGFYGAVVGLAYDPQRLTPLTPLVLTARPGTLAVGPAGGSAGLFRVLPAAPTGVKVGGVPAGWQQIWIELERRTAGPLACTQPSDTLATVRFIVQGSQTDQLQQSWLLLPGQVTNQAGEIIRVEGANRP
ncbi:MAG: hypothetical protein IMX01_02565 [Limnochordaceae bacterium]|nr:hypothetical protein [Limnochordaceae bacterium]